MRLLTALISALALVIAFSAAAMADFSADTVTTSPQGGMKGKIYSTSSNGYGGKMLRMETSAEGRNTIMIIDREKQVMYILMPDKKMYMKQKIEANNPNQKGTIEKPASMTFIRNDKFDGHPVKVYKAKTADGKEIIVWEAADLNKFPVKVEIPSEKVVMEYHNVSTKPVSKSMFEIPAGYRAFDMSGMPGMGAGMMGR